MTFCTLCKGFNIPIFVEFSPCAESDINTSYNKMSKVLRGRYCYAITNTGLVMVKRDSVVVTKNLLLWLRE